MATVILLDYNSNADAMAWVDVKLFNSYIGDALPCDCEYCHSPLLLWHGAAVRDFKFGAERCFLGIRQLYIYIYILCCSIPLG